MDLKTHEAVLNGVREMERSMRVEVKIPRDEIDRIVVTQLIGIRNSEVNRNNDMNHFDKVIRHYLDESEFQKYVIERQEIAY